MHYGEMGHPVLDALLLTTPYLPITTHHSLLLLGALW